MALWQLVRAIAPTHATHAHARDSAARCTSESARPIRGISPAPLADAPSCAHPAPRAVGRSTHRPNGWNYHTCCDCTHFCFSPAMWHAHLHSVQQEILQAPGIKAYKRPEAPPAHWNTVPV